MPSIPARSSARAPNRKQSLASSIVSCGMCLIALSCFWRSTCASCTSGFSVFSVHSSRAQPLISPCYRPRTRSSIASSGRTRAQSIPASACWLPRRCSTSFGLSSPLPFQNAPARSHRIHTGPHRRRQTNSSRIVVPESAAMATGPSRHEYHVIRFPLENGRGNTSGATREPTSGRFARRA